MSRNVLVPSLVLACLAGAPAQAQEKPTDGLKKLSSILDAKPLKAEAAGDELQRKLMERYNNTALHIYDLRVAGSIAGAVGPDKVFEAARLVLDAELALKSGPQEQLPVRQKMVDIARLYEDILSAAAKAGQAVDLDRARYDRLTAEIELLKAKKGLEKK